MAEGDRAQAAADRLAEHILADARRRNHAAAAAGEPRPPLRACLTCDDPIEAARLAANPSTRRCLHCQEAAERLARTHRRGVAA